MNNRWNQIIYRLWAPIYDATVGYFFMPGRKRAIELLCLQPGERVMLVGVGSGVDLQLLRPGVEAIGMDISAYMLAKARQKLPIPGLDVILLQGDAQNLLLGESTCDAAIFNLILSVIPDAADCMHENLRAIKNGGRAVIFDKFVPEGKTISFTRKIINCFSTMFGTDINRRLSELIQGCSCEVIYEE
jgi:phosphatidylethanolamine/phosphatidyl-N-methylethanolamine N-methyltransferase